MSREERSRMLTRVKRVVALCSVNLGDKHEQTLEMKQLLGYLLQQQQQQQQGHQ
jgi:hypothetical protein